MTRRVSCLAGLAGLLLSLAISPAGAARDDPYERVEDVLAQTRLMASFGYNSTGIINFLTFRDGAGDDGWNWQFMAAWPVQRPFFVEAGVMGWTLGRTTGGDAERFGLAAAAGMSLPGGQNEFGIGVIPNGGRVFFRHLLNAERRGKGPLIQLGIVFPSPSGTRSFTDLSVGYVF